MSQAVLRRCFPAAAVCTASLAAACTQPAVPQPQQQAAAEVGRYVITHSPQTERDVILLDTATGKTWSLGTNNWLNNDPYAWQPVIQMNTQQDRQSLIDIYGLKPAGSKSPSGAQASPQ